MEEFLRVNGVGGVALVEEAAQSATEPAMHRMAGDEVHGLAGEETAELGAPAALQPARVVGLLRTAALLCGSALACCVAAAGLGLLLFLLVSRSLAPAAAHFERDLYFDYTRPDVVATASFLFTGAAANAPPLVKVSATVCQITASQTAMLQACQGLAASSRVPHPQPLLVLLSLDFAKIALKLTARMMCCSLRLVQLKSA